MKTDRIAGDVTLYAYAADTARMLDVFHVDLERPDPGAQRGSWLTPEEAAREAAARALLDDGTVRVSCLLG